MKNNTPLQFCLLVIGIALWFCFLLPWDRMPDPDAFYHAKMALLTWQNGPITYFPWLDLTTLGTRFADQHFLFHVLQIPFVAQWGLLSGSRVSSLVFAVIGMLAMAWVFYKLRLKPFWAWAALLAISDPFSTRMILGKASPLIVAVFFVAIGNSLWDGRRRGEGGIFVRFIKFIRFVRLSERDKLIYLPNFITYVCGLLFALLHGGWIILIAAMFMLVLGRVLFGMAIAEQSVWKAIKNAGWNHLLAVTLGVATGLALHPGRAQLFDFLWTVVFKIGVVAPQGLAKGMEWNAANLSGGVGAFSIFGIVLLLCILGLLFSRKTFNGASTDELKNAIRPIVILGPLLAALFALTIKSVRFAEYFQPILALWTAMLAQLVDWEHIFDKLKFDPATDPVISTATNLGEVSGQARRSFMRRWEKSQRFKFVTFVIFGLKRLSKSIGEELLPATVIMCAVVSIFSHVWSSYNSLHGIWRFMDNQYQIPMRAISAQAQPGDRVYHSNWDEFPVLFAMDDRLRYVSGMDATFLYEASSTMAMDYQNFVFKAASSTTDELWGFVHGKLGAKYVLVDQERWQDLAKLIEKDPRYQKLAQGDGGTAYKVSSDH